MMTRIGAADPRDGIAWLAEHLRTKLDAGSVLWLLSGGSAIDIAVAVAAQLATHPDRNRLTVSLVDERFGEPGHADSNWQQLLERGFSIPGATLVPILQGEDLTTTAETFAATFARLRHETDHTIGLFGMGTDGHTAGILPYSSAVEATGLIYAYDWPPYQRITLTTQAIRELHEGVLYAAGSDKWPQLQRLFELTLPIPEQPVQILKSLPNFTVLTDYKGENT